MSGQASRPTGLWNLFEIRHGNIFPHIMGKMARKELIEQVDGPENIVDDQ
jgi:hypothetical protein